MWQTVVNRKGSYFKCIIKLEHPPLERPRFLIYDNVNSKTIATLSPTMTAPLDEVELPEPGQTFIPGTALKTIKFIV